MEMVNELLEAPQIQDLNRDEPKVCVLLAQFTMLFTEPTKPCEDQS